MNIKNQKGITLIALVITIIVLIILAGISINLLFGDNGIINKAKNAGEVSEKADIEEKLKLAYSSVVIDKYVDGITDLSSRLQVELQKSFPSNDVSVTLNGNGSYQVIIQGKGTYTIGEGGKAEEVRLAGFYKNNGEYVSWQELIDRNLILVEGTVLKRDDDRIDNDIMVLDAKDWVGTLVIDDSITEIEDWSINFLVGTKKVIIPAATTYIDPQAFEMGNYVVNGVAIYIEIDTIEVNPNNQYYTSVNGVLYSKDMKTIVKAPYTLSGTYVIPNGVQEVGPFCFEFTKISSVVIPNGVTKIGVMAFAFCDNLTELNLPNTVTTIELGMTDYSCNILNINMPSGGTAYKSVDGVIYSRLGQNLVDFPKGRTGTYNVPSGTIRILWHAFRGSLIENVNFPNTLESIYGEAFWGIKNFTHIVLPDSIKVIADYAFCGYRDDEHLVVDDVTYKGVTYTSKSALRAALIANGVDVYEDAFTATELSD